MVWELVWLGRWEGFEEALQVQCPKTRWSGCGHCQRRMREEGLPDEYALQSWFIGRINRFLLGRGNS